jgi:hypothetical protein
VVLMHHFSLRSDAGDLLVLSSYDPVGPGDSFAQTDVAGWADPFTELTAVDHECARVENPRARTAPETWKPFALTIGTDDGPVSLFDGQQQMVTQDGATYEVSVAQARMDIPCPDCPEHELRFSIVAR